ncbi:unnamed protein product [Absidia cylindrospora]
MEYLFQADINGALERLDKMENGHEPSDHSLEAEQDATYLHLPGDQADELRDPVEACHAVLFKAWIGRTDALTSFSVSRYRRGVLPNEYYQIIEALQLTSHFKTSIYALYPEVAMKAMQGLLPHIETCRLYDYLSSYLRVVQSLSWEQSIFIAIECLCEILGHHTDTQSIQQLLSILSSIYASGVELSPHHCYTYHRLVELIYKTSLNIIKTDLPYSWNKLLKLMDGKFCAFPADMVIPPPSSTGLDNEVANQDTLIDKNAIELCADPNMIELWNSSLATTTTPQRKHEYAFELICMGIWKNTVPSRDMMTTIAVYDYQQPMTPDRFEAKPPPFFIKWSSACDVLSTHLLSLDSNDKVEISPHLYSCMTSSLETLTNLSGSWKSIMKVMTQFADIWVRVLPNKECLVAFADLIVLAGNWTYLYQFVINVINYPCGEEYDEIVSKAQKSSLCALVRMVIEQLETNALLELIYDTYSDRSLPADDNTFKHDLFDDMTSLQKCCNQFVHTEQEDEKSYGDSGEQDQGESHILHQLAMLAVLSPYETVSRLVHQGIENKGQHDIVASILRQLGDLCMLRRFPGDNTLFAHVLGFVLSNHWHYPGLDILAPLLLSCWKNIRNPSTSILLDSYTSIACTTSNNPIIIHPKELLDDYLLPALQQYEDLALVNDILGLLYALGEDTSSASEKWKQQLDQHVSHIPILLDMDVDILMKALTHVMDERFNREYMTPQDTQTTGTLGLSIALDLGRKLTMTIQHVFTLFKNTPELLADIKLKLLRFYDDLDNFDWEIQLFWQEGYRSMIDNDTSPLYVPRAIFTLLQTITDSATGKNEDSLWMPIDDQGNNMTLDSDQQWTMILGGCRSSALFTDELFNHANTRIYDTEPFWKHPYESVAFHEQLARNLHPSFTTATYYEYKLLLIHFLGRLYDLHGNNDVMRRYQYDDPNTAHLVELLTTEHCRILFMALHSLLLLKIPHTINAKVTTLEDGELYYVSGIVQTVQAMANWQRLGMDPSIQSLTRKHISNMALSPENAMEPTISTRPETKEAHHALPETTETPASTHPSSTSFEATNIHPEMTEPPTTENTHPETAETPAHPSSSDATKKAADATRTTTTTRGHTKQQDIIDCYYPWMNKNRRSGRALCLLMIEVICCLSTSVQLRKSYDVLRVLLLQMIEGLEGRQERDTLMDQCSKSKQPKAYITKWKKNKKDRRIRVHLRPTLTEDEIQWINTCCSYLPYTDDQAILQNLVRTPSSSPILYIYNSYT